MTINYLLWYLERGEGPLLATAIHDGHETREELEPLFALSGAKRNFQVLDPLDYCPCDGYKTLAFRRYL